MIPAAVTSVGSGHTRVSLLRILDVEGVGWEVSAQGG